MIKHFKYSLFAAIICSIFLSCGSRDIEADKKMILQIMNDQEKAWNNYNIEGFMTAYWKNDSLKFYGGSGLTLGWQQTLDNYHKRYPSVDHTGHLNFLINDITAIENDSYYVMGEYLLTRPIGDASGIFMIIFKKINGEWKIIADTSC